MYAQRNALTLSIYYIKAVPMEITLPQPRTPGTPRICLYRSDRAAASPLISEEEQFLSESFCTCRTAAFIEANMEVFQGVFRLSQTGMFSLIILHQA